MSDEDKEDIVLVHKTKQQQTLKLSQTQSVLILELGCEIINKLHIFII